MAEEIPNLVELWTGCDADRRARQFIGAKSVWRKLVDEDDFVQEVWLHASGKYPEFDPDKGDIDKSLTDKFVTWLYWKMKATKTTMLRQVLSPIQHGFKLIEIDANTADNNFGANAYSNTDTDIVAGLDNYIFRQWLGEEFAIEVEELCDLDVLIEIVKNVIECFSHSKKVMLKNQSLVLNCIFTMINETGKNPDLYEVAERLELEYPATTRAYESAVRQIRYALKTYYETTETGETKD